MTLQQGAEAFEIGGGSVAAVEGDAIFVDALVRERRQELMGKITVSAVQLDHVITNTIDTLGGGGEFANR